MLTLRPGRQRRARAVGARDVRVEPRLGRGDGAQEVGVDDGQVPAREEDGQGQEAHEDDPGIWAESAHPPGADETDRDGGRAGPTVKRDVVDVSREASHGGGEAAQHSRVVRLERERIRPGDGICRSESTPRRRLPYMYSPVVGYTPSPAPRKPRAGSEAGDDASDWSPASPCRAARRVAAPGRDMIGRCLGWTRVSRDRQRPEQAKASGSGARGCGMATRTREPGARRGSARRAAERVRRGV